MAQALSPEERQARFGELSARLHEELALARSATEAAQLAVTRIHDALPAYAWVGVYWLRGETLELGPYCGAPTPHTRIPVGRGVCGTAVATGANQIVADVQHCDNYLSCSLETRSEIVVLLRAANGRVVGQIDADGHLPAAFDEADEAFLQALGALILRAGAV